MANRPTTTRLSPIPPAASRPSFGHWSPGGLFGLLRVVVRRLWSHRALLAALVAGFVVAVAMVVSIPVYAEAVGYRVLRDELSRSASGAAAPGQFGFLYRYLGAQGGTTWDEFVKLDRYFNDRAAATLGLPVRQRGRYASTDKRGLFGADGTGKQLEAVNVAFTDELEKQITLVDGRMPQSGADGPIEVLMNDAMASRLGVQIGDQYTVLGPRENPRGKQFPVRVAGVWRAIEPDDPFWFFGAMSAETTLYVPQQSFTERLLKIDHYGIAAALWFMGADGSGIRSSDVPAVSGRIAQSARDVDQLLQGTKLDVSPGGVLQRHQERVPRLTLVLTLFSLPLLALIAYFVVLVGGMSVQRQSNEIAVLRSRGTSRLQVLGIYMLEGALLGLLALSLGLPLGQAAASLMTWTRSFLDAAPVAGLPIDLTNEAWRRALLVLALLVLALLVPAFGAARFTIVSFKSERARSLRRPLWQKLCVDLLLLVPVWYGYQQLKERGTVSFLGLGGGAGDPFSNPLLLLTPTLYILTFALIAARLFPAAMALLAKVWGVLPGVSGVTALRYLARSPRSYTGPLLLLTITLSLATFTASMARTLDRHLFDQVFYETGGDMRLSDLGQDSGSSGAPTGAPPPGSGAAPAGQAPGIGLGSQPIDEQNWLFLPVSEYLNIPGVKAATRIAYSEAEVRLAGGATKAQFVGVDRADLPSVVHWRDDYADESLGALLNRLADEPASVLVSAELAGKGVRVGDRLTVSTTGLGGQLNLSVVVAGFIRYFPTIYPEDGPIVVGDLDYVFEQKGGQYPYDVWLRLEDGTTQAMVNGGTASLGLRTIERDYAPKLIAAERERPERQGLFGLLSVGFLGAAFLTVVGFLFYSVLSYQRRFVELGVLRAMGLSVRQLGTLLGWDQALLIGAGAVAGTAIGLSASILFIPFLQVRGGDHPQTPPFVVQIAWDQIWLIYSLFGALLLLSVLSTIALMQRMRLFQAVKLGETV